MERLRRLSVLGVLVSIITSPAFSVILYNYGWEDTQGTVLGAYGLISASNENAPNTSYGNHSLKLTDLDSSSTPRVYLTKIMNLQDGDQVKVCFWVWDTTFYQHPSSKILGHYLGSDDMSDTAGLAGVNSKFSTWYGWNKLEYTWTFNSNGGLNQGLVIACALYGNSGDTVWLDNLSIWAPDGAIVTMIPEPTTFAVLLLGLPALKRCKRHHS